MFLLRKSPLKFRVGVLLGVCLAACSSTPGHLGRSPASTAGIGCSALLRAAVDDGSGARFVSATERAGSQWNFVNRSVVMALSDALSSEAHRIVFTPRVAKLYEALGFKLLSGSQAPRFKFSQPPTPFFALEQVSARIKQGLENGTLSADHVIQPGIRFHPNNKDLLPAEAAERSVVVPIHSLNNFDASEWTLASESKVDVGIIPQQLWERWMNPEQGEALLPLGGASADVHDIGHLVELSDLNRMRWTREAYARSRGLSGRALELWRDRLFAWAEMWSLVDPAKASFLRDFLGPGYGVAKGGDDEEVLWAIQRMPLAAQDQLSQRLVQELPLHIASLGGVAHDPVNVYRRLNAQAVEEWIHRRLSKASVAFSGDTVRPFVEESVQGYLFRVQLLSSSQFRMAQRVALKSNGFLQWQSGSQVQSRLVELHQEQLARLVMMVVQSIELQVTPEQWIFDLSQPVFDLNSPSAKYLTRVLPPDSVVKALLFRSP